MRFCDFSSEKVVDINHGLWFRKATNTTTIQIGDTRELVLAELADDGAVCFEDDRQTNVDKAIGRLVLGFGEWLVDVDLHSRGFRQVLPRMKLVTKPDGHATIDRWFAPMRAPGTELPHRDFPK